MGNNIITVLKSFCESCDSESELTVTEEIITMESNCNYQQIPKEDTTNTSRKRSCYSDEPPSEKSKLKRTNLITCEEINNDTIQNIPVGNETTNVNIGSNLSENKHLHINQLPHHILMSIFKHLKLIELTNVASLVCKFWHVLATDPALWREIHLKGQNHVDDDILFRLTSLSGNVSVLDISDTKFVTTQGFVRVAQQCTALRRLKLVR